MTAIELKKALIKRIVEINDISFLNDINTFLDSKTHAGTMVLNSEQKGEIYKSKKQIEQGLFIDQIQVEKEFDAWLSAK